MKRTRLRYESKKTTDRKAECQDFRAALVAEVGHCEMCGHDPRKTRPGMIAWELCCHEIANGANRQKCLDKRFGLLVLCWPCNSEEATNKAIWPEARQLALLKRSRPKDYNLPMYMREFHPRAPFAITEEEVDTCSL